MYFHTIELRFLGIHSMEHLISELCSMKQSMPPQVEWGVMLQMYAKTMFHMIHDNGTKLVVSLEAIKM